MRILWVIHDVLEQFLPYVVKGKPSTGGSWITPLFNSLCNNESIKLGVISPIVNGQYFKKHTEEAIFYSIPIKQSDNQRRMRQPTIGFYLKVIDDFKPDIVHFHGTEKNFGLLREHVKNTIPIVGSIQGIINSYLPYLYMASSDVKYTRSRSLKNWLGKGGITSMKKKWETYSKIECEIFLQNQYFIGRTLWDKSQAYSLNPKLNYFHAEELLREPFYTTDWDINQCEPHSIFISSGAYPIKGLHVLIRAINILKGKYPKMKVYVPLFQGGGKPKVKDYLLGDDYPIYIRSLILKFKLQENFIPLKRLSAVEMANQFAQSHVFVLPSFIENSPNSLGEAMMVGTPTITSFAGGVGSIIENEKSSLLFPIGDFRTLAYQIDRIFSDKSLAIKLSQQAKQVADRRHDIEITTRQYIDIYKQIIIRHHESSSSV